MVEIELVETLLAVRRPVLSVVVLRKGGTTEDPPPPAEIPVNCEPSPKYFP